MANGLGPRASVRDLIGIKRQCALHDATSHEREGDIMNSKSDQKSSGGMKRAISGTRHEPRSAKRAVALVSLFRAEVNACDERERVAVGRTVQIQG